MTPADLRHLANTPFCVVCNAAHGCCEHSYSDEEEMLKKALRQAADEIERLRSSLTCIEGMGNDCKSDENEPDPEHCPQCCAWEALQGEVKP